MSGRCSSALPRKSVGGEDRRDGALVLRAARQWLAAIAAAVFCFVHLFDMHKPYAVSYDAQLAYVDRLLGGFQQR